MSVAAHATLSTPYGRIYQTNWRGVCGDIVFHERLNVHLFISNSVRYYCPTTKLLRCGWKIKSCIGWISLVCLRIRQSLRSSHFKASRSARPSQQRPSVLRLPGAIDWRQQPLIAPNCSRLRRSWPDSIKKFTAVRLCLPCLIHFSIPGLK